jgi:hypothetical protein
VTFFSGCGTTAVSVSGCAGRPRTASSEPGVFTPSRCEAAPSQRPPAQGAWRHASGRSSLRGSITAQPPPLRDTGRAWAQRGGCLARTGDGESSINSRWHGYQRLHEFLYAGDPPRRQCLLDVYNDEG